MGYWVLGARWLYVYFPLVEPLNAFAVNFGKKEFFS